MRRITRYVLGEFLKPLAFVLLVFVGLYVIAQLVDDMRGFVRHQPSIAIVVMYYLYRIPFYAVQVMPMAVLLSALLSLGQLSRSNELIAMRACGIPFFRITVPVLSAALGVTALMLVFDEIVIPETQPRAEYIQQVKIERKEEKAFRYRRDRLARATAGNRLIFMRDFDALAGTMGEVLLFEMGERQEVRRRVDAARAQWVDGAWMFLEGRVREFDPGGRLVRAKPFTALTVPFKETPRDFIRVEKRDEQLLAMPARELHRRIRLLRDLGLNARREEVNYHLKFAFPFSNFVLALLGVSIPFVFPSGRRAVLGAAIGFIITLTTGFFYIGFLAVGTSLGGSGALPPLVSVWIANIAFGLLGTWMMFRASR